MKTPSLIVSSKGESNIEPVPEGLHAGVLVGLYDVGTQYSEKFDNSMRKLVLAFELPELPLIEVERDGEKKHLPRVVSLRLTRSLNEKSRLRALLESWRGKRLTPEEANAFDMARVLGIPALVQVMHEQKPDGKVFANVNNLLPLPKGQAVQASTPPFLFSVDQLEAPADIEGAGLPQWIADLVKGSREFERLSKRSVKAVTPSRPASAPLASAVAPGAEEDDVAY